MLLQRYRIAGFDGTWIHFQRIEGQTDPFSYQQPIEQLAAKIGSNVVIPQDAGPICAQINLRETLLGKAVDRIFKLPEIGISLTLTDGTTVNRRYIPGMGKRGFLISPFIPGTEAFDSFATGMFNLQSVRSFRIEAPKTKFWHHNFEVTFTHFEMLPQTDAQQFFGSARTDLPATSIRPAEGVDEKCALDSFEDFGGQPAVGSKSSQSLKLAGWAIASVKNGKGRLVYLLSHNIARREIVENRPVWVHRKGATRAFPAGHPALHGTPFAGTGHSILLPGNPDCRFMRDGRCTGRRKELLLREPRCRAGGGAESSDSRT
jgi:tRNA-splicing ligase RtcB